MLVNTDQLTVTSLEQPSTFSLSSCLLLSHTCVFPRGDETQIVVLFQPIQAFLVCSDICTFHSPVVCSKTRQLL